MSQSDATKELINSEDIQIMMKSFDTESLVQTKAFNDFYNQQGMQEVINKVIPDNIQDPKQHVAEKMTQVWNTINQVQQNPEVAKLMQDPEVQGLIQSNNIAALLVKPEMRQLVAEVVSNLGQMKKIESLKKTLGIYKWTDATGKVNFTDYDSVPDAFKNTAEQIQ